MFGIALPDRQRAVMLWTKSANDIGDIIKKHLCSAPEDDIEATARKAAHYGIRALDISSKPS